MLTIVPGVLPFGLIMGALARTAELTHLEIAGMNLLVFAGASQLVVINLLMRDVPSTIIILTGIVINLRMILYSISFSDLFKESSILRKTFASYLVTDQSYAIYTANSHELKGKSQRIPFYFGAGLCMAIFWQLFVNIGFIFGNFVPVAINLDFAIPLSFIALMIPTLRNKIYYYVAAISSLCSILFYDLPYNLGLLVSAFVAISCGFFLMRRGSV